MKTARTQTELSERVQKTYSDFLGTQYSSQRGTRIQNTAMMPACTTSITEIAQAYEHKQWVHAVEQPQLNHHLLNHH